MLDRLEKNYFQGNRNITNANSIDGKDLTELLNDVIDEVNAGGNISYAGEFEVNDLVVGPSITYTIELPLNRNDYNLGHILFHVPHDVSLTANRGMTFYCDFTNDVDGSISFAGTRKSYTIVGYNGLPYYFNDYFLKGYSYVKNSKLSDLYFFDNGQQSGLRGQLLIESCQIVNNKIELKIKNTHASRNTNITIIGRYNVSKV